MRIAALVGMSLALGCGGGGGADGGPDPRDPAPSNIRYEPDDDRLQLALTGPSLTGTYATSSTDLTLRGLASPDVETITWENTTTGQDGAGVPGASWSATVPLGSGDNTVVVTARRGAQEASAVFFAVQHADADGLVPPRLTPNGVMIPDTTSVVLGLRVPSTLNPTAVEAWKIDAAGVPVEKVADLFDDGDPLHGDDTALDETYSGLFDEEPTEAGVTLLRGKILHAGGEVWSPPAPLLAAHPIDPTAFADSLAVQDVARARYEEVFGTDGHEAAVRAALDSLATSPLVAEAGRSFAEAGIWVIYEAGFLGGLLLSPDGSKGCGDEDECPPIPEANLFCLAPFEEEFRELFFDEKDEAQLIQEFLQGRACPTYDPVFLDGGPNANLESVKLAGTYGVFVMSTHGENWYGRPETLSEALIGAGGPLHALADWAGVAPDSSVSILLLAEPLTPENMSRYVTDLALGRLIAVTSKHSDATTLAITPAFVRAYFDMPNSFAYVSACFSARNRSLADAFLCSGAKAYVGYTAVVDAVWAGEKGLQLFTDMSNGLPLGEAFVPGTGPRGASIAMFGDPRLMLPDGSIENPSFEDGMEGWLGSGTAEQSVGEIVPPEPEEGECNEYLAKVRILGSMSQTICIPEDATKIRFQYDFVSQSLKEVCGVAGLETEVFVTFTPTDAGIPPQDWLALREGDVCGSVSLVDAGFVDNQLDTDETWHTGWTLREIDVTGLQGEEGELVFRVINPDPPLPALLLVDQLEWEYER